MTENLTEVGHQAQAAWSTFANKNLKNTSLPIPIPAEKSKGPIAPKTLPHALSRAAKSGATELGNDDRLGVALGTYAVAMEKVSTGGEMRWWLSWPPMAHCGAVECEGGWRRVFSTINTPRSATRVSRRTVSSPSAL